MKVMHFNLLKCNIFLLSSNIDMCPLNYNFLVRLAISCLEVFLTHSFRVNCLVLLFPLCIFPLLNSWTLISIPPLSRPLISEKVSTLHWQEWLRIPPLTAHQVMNSVRRNCRNHFVEVLFSLQISNSWPREAKSSLT